MQKVTAETLSEAAARALAGDAQLFVTNPADGVLYRFRLRPDIIAKPPTLLSGEVNPTPRRVFVMSRVDGEEMPHSWGRTRAEAEHDVYCVEHLAGLLHPTMERGGTVEIAPFYGPHPLTLADQAELSERANGWTARRAPYDLRRMGNRDLYLCHLQTGAGATIYPRGGSADRRRAPFAAALPGGRTEEFPTRRAAFEFVKREAVPAYLAG